MLREPRRLIAAGIAIALSTAFITVGLVMRDTVSASIHEFFAGDLGDAKAVVRGADPYGGGSADQAKVTQTLRAKYGSELRVHRYAYLMPSSDSPVKTQVVLSDLPASTPTVISGRLPQGPHEVVANERIGDRLPVGSTYTTIKPRQPSAATTKPGAAEKMDYQVVGVVQIQSLEASTSGPALYGAPQALDRYAVGAANSAVSAQWYVHAPGAQDEVVRQVRATLRTAGVRVQLSDATAPDAAPRASSVRAPMVQVKTADDVLAEKEKDFQQALLMLSAILMVFVLVTVFVSVLVVSNTFAIVIAQRVRQIALLRCVGATRRQIFKGALGEALMLGLAASIVGVFGGITLGWIVARVASNAYPSFPVSTFSVGILSVILPLLTGVLATLMASLVPARAATRVDPMTALRPAQSRLRPRVRVWRLMLGLGLFLLGLVGLVLGVLGRQGLLTVVSGMVNFVGLLIMMRLFLPTLVGIGGWFPRSVGGVPGELAVDNARRDPSRSTAATNALLVGVTLISVMSVGAATAKSSAEASVNRSLPVDVIVGINTSSVEAGPDGAASTQTQKPVDSAASLNAIAADTRVQRSTRVTTVAARISPSVADSNPGDRAVQGFMPDAVAVMIDPRTLEGLSDQVLLIRTGVGYVNGQRVTLRGATDNELQLTAKVSDYYAKTPRITAKNAAELGGAPGTEAALSSELWLKLKPNVNPEEFIRDIDTFPGVVVDGGAAMRVAIRQIINVLFYVAVGLLTVSLLVALVGITNTLGLSVLERTNEIGLLRALGLTRQQLRAAVVIEVLVLAGVAVTTGLVVGGAYALSSSYAILSSDPSILFIPTIDWPQLGLIVLIALIAGLVASVGPMVRALRVSPITAIRAE